MKNKRSYSGRLLIAVITAVTFIQFTTAQETTLNAAASKVTLYGTSNIHDWEMTAETMSGTAVFAIDKSTLASIEKLKFVVGAEGLKSGKKAMDNNTYKALHTDRHKDITYILTSCTNTKSLGNETYNITTKGKLTIAGVTKEIPITFHAKVDGKKVTLTGEVNLNMTTYNVEPPKALMGTIKTGDALTIKFQTIYN